jgi:hypothetical protein
MGYTAFVLEARPVWVLECGSLFKSQHFEMLDLAMIALGDCPLTKHGPRTLQSIVAYLTLAGLLSPNLVWTPPGGLCLPLPEVLGQALCGWRKAELGSVVRSMGSKWPVLPCPSIPS